MRVARDMAPNGVQRPALVKAIADCRAEFAGRNAAMQRSDAFPTMPERILADLRAEMPRDAILASDVGWNKNGVAQQFAILIPGGFATMGFGPPAALGAKIAAPERCVISLVGDGGFGQNPAVLATAVAEGLAVIWVVMNNTPPPTSGHWNILDIYAPGRAAGHVATR